MSDETKVMETLDKLEKFINQRPILDPADYGLGRGQTPGRKQWFEDFRAFEKEKRDISKDGTRARKALAEARNLPANWEALQDAFKSAFSGRLSYTDGELDYCTGQYYPTEYRKAAATVLEHYNHAVRLKFAPPQGRIFEHASQIKGASQAAGSHFFDKGSMRFFRSRVLPTVFHGPGGCYFVTSEQFEGSNGHRAERKYTVRKFDVLTAEIDTVGKFNELTRAEALQQARALAEKTA